MTEGPNRLVPERSTLSLRLVLARAPTSEIFGRVLVNDTFVELGKAKPAVSLAIFLGQLVLSSEYGHAESMIRFGGDTGFGGRLYRAFSVGPWPRWAMPLEQLRELGVWPPWKLERGWLRTRPEIRLPIDGACWGVDDWLAWRDDQRVAGEELWVLLIALAQTVGVPVDDMDPRLRRHFEGSSSIEAGLVVTNGVHQDEAHPARSGYPPIATDVTVEAGPPCPLEKNPNLSAISSLLCMAAERGNGLSVRSIRSLPELKDLWEIDNRAYGTANVDFAVFKSWWLAYPTGLHAILHHEQILGAIGIWPVPEAWLAEFLKGGSSESELSPAEVADAAARPCSSWYLSGIVLDAKHNTSAISYLVRQASLAWALEATLHLPVTMTAMAISEHGERLLGRFGFSLVLPGEACKDGFPLYARTFDRNDLRALIS